MIMPHTFDTFGCHLASALAETLELQSHHLRGEKLYGATLVPATDNLMPRFAVLEDSDTAGMESRRRWAPDDFSTALGTPRLNHVCGRTRDLRDSWPGTSEEWHHASLAALSDALGSRAVRLTLRRLGADPILYIFDGGECGIEPTTFRTLNAGRESEPYYLQAARCLL